MRIRCFVTMLTLATSSVVAAELRPFEDLRLAVEAQRSQLPVAQRDALAKQTDNLVDCAVYEPIVSQDPRAQMRYSQYILNSNYEWGYLEAGRGPCVVLRFPIQRPLSRKEAVDLITASHMSFPVPFYEQPPQVQKVEIAPSSTRCDPMPMVDLQKNTTTIAPCRTP
jgi:hypothetical protein